MDRDQLQQKIWALYEREHRQLGENGTVELLERGQALNQQFQLAQTLTAGGVLVFPHAGVADCGHQISACVQAVLESGADKVLVISVLHAFTEEMQLARHRVSSQGGAPSAETHWGIQGPGLPGREEWRYDHALMSWRHFWEAEIKRRNLKNPPQVIERYPYLAGGKPWELPNFEETQKWAEEAVIVSTADAFHHGLGYGDDPREVFWPDETGLQRAKTILEEGITLLEAGDYWGYDQHCVQVKSDARDAGQLFRYLRGPLHGRVVDLTSSDAANLYQAPSPTWVAAALFQWDKEGA